MAQETRWMGGGREDYRGPQARHSGLVAGCHRTTIMDITKEGAMKRTFLAAAILLFAATACGTLYGAGIGAGSGAAIAAGTGHNPATGALLGAGIGAAAGAIYDATRPVYMAPQPSCYTQPGYWSQVPAYGYGPYPTYQNEWVPPQTVCR